MNGAESLVRTLVASGIDTCFANPGTSEMHFVAALDAVPGIRCVLCLFEGGATGAADGYARIAEKPATTLLHLGPGLGNGIANLHNARRARSPVVNIVGEHATHHLQHDAPLTSDIEGLARPVSHWVRTSRSARTVAADAAEAVAVARTPPGRVATLILPADTAWDEAEGPAAPLPLLAAPRVLDETVARAASALRAGEATLLIGGAALRAKGLELAGRIAAATGARLLAPGSNARVERGAGRVAVERVPYPVDIALTRLAESRRFVLLGATSPVAFFAYPGKPSRLTPEGAEIVALARPEDDIIDALERLVDAVGARNARPLVEKRAEPVLPKGALTPESIGAVLGALIPEGAIICDESVTTGRGFFRPTAGAAPHDWMQLTGGAIGEGIPLATGAAVAAPGRKVINLQADGSGMYTLQCLWTQARERLDVVTLVWANRSYAILKGELANVGAKNVGRTALDMLSLDDPALDWVSLARGMGIEGARVETAEALANLLRAAIGRRGPFLIEVAL